MAASNQQLPRNPKMYRATIHSLQRKWLSLIVKLVVPKEAGSDGIRNVITVYTEENN